jgi:chromosome condensin MukBEF ATPase and DNA-binding subunit MukB
VYKYVYGKMDDVIGCSYKPFHVVFDMWSVFFLLGLTSPRYRSSAKDRWKSALHELLVKAEYESRYGVELALSWPRSRLLHPRQSH